MSSNTGKQRSTRSSHALAPDSQVGAPSGTSQETTPVVSSMEQVTTVPAAETSVSSPPLSGALTPDNSSSAVNTSAPSFAQLLAGSASMDLDNPPVVDRLARLQALVSTKEGILYRLQEQFEDALLDSEIILNGQPHDQKERLIRERDVLIAALKGNISQAENELAQAKQALNRRLFPVPANLNPHIQPFTPIVYQDACNVPPVYSNKEHGALVRIEVKGSIPVFQGTHTVDYERLVLPSFKDELILELTPQLKSSKRENFEAKLVELIFLFLNRFEKFYRDKLADLFDILAYRYMSQILTKADLEQRLDQRFDDLMKLIVLLLIVPGIQLS